MAIIPARKPYYITHFGQQLDIDLYIYDYNDTKPTSPNYTLKKLSFEDGTDETLSLDISPYIRDFFYYTEVPKDYTFPDGGAQMPEGMYLKVDAVVNTVEENHTALNGWVQMGTQTSEGISDFVRPYSLNVSFRKGSFSTVRYTDQDGTIESHSIASTTNEYVTISPRPPVGDPGTRYTMELIGSKTATYTFKSECVFEEDAYNVGFVNKWGLVEWVTMLGAAKKSIRVKSEDFINAEDRLSNTYNAHGNYRVKLNTGWLEGDYLGFLEGLMMSENIWIQGIIASEEYGDNDIYNAKLLTNAIDTKTSRGDKLSNITFDFELTPEVIYG